MILGHGAFAANALASAALHPHTTSGDIAAGSAAIVGASHAQRGELSAYHRALLEALARVHGLIDPLAVTSASRGDGTLVQTIALVGTTTTVTTTAGPSGAPGVDALTAQESFWLTSLARLHGLIDPLTVTETARGDGTVQQSVAEAAGTVTVTLV